MANNKPHRIPKVLIFIVSYHAEEFIENVLDRIPEEIWKGEKYHTEVLIIDDCSPDKTFQKAEGYSRKNKKSNLTVLYNPVNQGYGGNQKIGYHYAIQNNFDVVVLLHGDGQYAPEHLCQMINPILKGEADAVFGSRMIHKWKALKGKMPFYKWIGNQILTFTQNLILGANLSEFHTGYRAYSVPALTSIPFAYNSNYFDFDTEIILQLLGTNRRIKEISVPTFYGGEISRVNGIKYAFWILHSSILSRVAKLGIYYSPRFDYEKDNNFYSAKFGFPSSHQFALDQVQQGSTVLDIGCGPGIMAYELSMKGAKTISIDWYIHPDVKKYSFKPIQTDIEEYDFDSDLTKVDYILALDIIEHLKSPETFLLKLRNRYSKNAPWMIVTTGNIAFFPLRISLLFGQFNYGKMGLLDLDHTRLFTFYSLRRLLVASGYHILEERGIPAPFPLALGDNWLSRFLLLANSLFIRLSKNLFSYQIAFVVKTTPTLSHLLDDAKEARKKKLSQIPTEQICEY